MLSERITSARVTWCVGLNSPNLVVRVLGQQLRGRSQKHLAHLLLQTLIEVMPKQIFHALRADGLIYEFEVAQLPGQLQMAVPVHLECVLTKTDEDVPCRLDLCLGQNVEFVKSVSEAVRCQVQRVL